MWWFWIAACASDASPVDSAEPELPDLTASTGATGSTGSTGSTESTPYAGYTAPTGLTSYHAEFYDEGMACVEAASADAPASVTVELGCTECVAYVEASVCQAVLGEGAVIELAASATVHVDLLGASTCTCSPIVVTCETPALSAGSWTLTYGGQSVAFEVPGAPTCVSATP